MINDMRVPKEKFLVEYFESKKIANNPSSVNFDDVLKSVQNKSDKNDLETIMGMPKKEAFEKIDKLEPKEIMPILNDSVNKLRSISKE